jgi:predicted GIY-YIG superfamily endonuclease
MMMKKRIKRKRTRTRIM